MDMTRRLDVDCDAAGDGYFFGDSWADHLNIDVICYVEKPLGCSFDFRPVGPVIRSKLQWAFFQLSRL